MINGVLANVRNGTWDVGPQSSEVGAQDRQRFERKTISDQRGRDARGIRTRIYIGRVEAAQYGIGDRRLDGRCGLKTYGQGKRSQDRTELGRQLHRHACAQWSDPFLVARMAGGVQG